jgi:colanic acid/amylovoran biosynthesis glycosyltransferase
MNHHLKVTWCAYDWRDNISGPGSWLTRLLPMLRERGISSVVDLLIWDETGPLSRSLEELGIQCRLQQIEGSTQERIHKLVARFSESTCDVYVPNLVTPALLAAGYIRKSGIPTVGVLHSDDDFYQGLVDVFIGGRRQEALSAVVTVSNCLSEKASSAALHGTLIKHIPYGVPIPRTSGFVGTREELAILYAGRLVQTQKRILDLTKAILRCIDEIPNCTATVIGDGPERDNILDLLNSHHAGKSIRLTGRVTPAEIQGLMNGHDIFLLLSDFEGLPIALLEAMACGLVPIVHKMRSGIPELIQNQINGLIVEDRSESVLNAVRGLYNNRTLLSRLSHNARETIINSYSDKTCADRWADLLYHLHTTNSCSRQHIRLPKSLDLPPVHPSLAAEDPRAENISILSRLLNKVRYCTKRITATSFAS